MSDGYINEIANEGLYQEFLSDDVDEKISILRSCLQKIEQETAPKIMTQKEIGELSIENTDCFIEFAKKLPKCCGGYGIICDESLECGYKYCHCEAGKKLNNPKES